MIRSFLPVGQGAFYCECFYEKQGGNKISIVYDCGSSSDKNILQQQIMNVFDKDEVIEALFVSHLDEDHINGIPFLLEYCKVNYIFYPLISHENKELMKIYYNINNCSEFLHDFLENPFIAMSSLMTKHNTKIIPIEEKSEDFEGQFEEMNPDLKRMRSGENVFDLIEGLRNTSNRNLFKWSFVPYNFRHKERVKQLLDNLKVEFGIDITSHEMSDLWQINANDDRLKVKRAYRKISGDFNTNSMTLFSGETSNRFNQIVMVLPKSSVKDYIYKYNYRDCWSGVCSGFGCYYCEDSCEINRIDADNRKPSGCLYMGDYNSYGNQKWEELKNAYVNFWEHIGCIQIPHHGSKNNFNIELAKKNVFHIISAGYMSRYKHPNTTVISALIKYNHMPYIVTEEARSIVCLKVFEI